MVSSKEEKRSYCLHLSGSQSWNFIATEGVRPWMEKFAAIMELPSCRENDFPKMIFSKKNSAGESPITEEIIKIHPHLPEEGWNAYDRRSISLWSHEKIPDVICEIAGERDNGMDIVGMWNSLHFVYIRAQEAGGLPLHAALVERSGKGIVLAGPGSGGKTTCCKRVPPSWRTLCDDETLVLRNNVAQYAAHPFPTWSEYLLKHSSKTWDVRKNVPLQAVFFLEKAERDEVVPLGNGQAAVVLSNSSIQVCRRTWGALRREETREIKKKLFYNACAMAENVPSFILRFGLTGRFWEKIEEALDKVSSKEKSMPKKNNPLANSTIVLREEFDDWAILFDPDSGEGFGLNPVGVFIWKLLDGKHSLDDILKDLRENCEEVPDEAKEHLKNFIHDLKELGFVGYEIQNE